MKLKIIKAKKGNIKEVGVLFDLYRQFYKYDPELKKSTKYIEERILQKESTIFLCYCDEQPAGFAQLYETFDSLNINKKLILYDLYVKKEFRKKGVGKSLMNIAKKFGYEKYMHEKTLAAYEDRNWDLTSNQWIVLPNAFEVTNFIDIATISPNSGTPGDSVSVSIYGASQSIFTNANGGVPLRLLHQEDHSVINIPNFVSSQWM